NENIPPPIIEPTTRAMSAVKFRFFSDGLCVVSDMVKTFYSLIEKYMKATK
ncbi:MAG: hypothetical protein ACI9MD_002405, partial [Psychrobacter glaciei]